MISNDKGFIRGYRDGRRGTVVMLHGNGEMSWQRVSNEADEIHAARLPIKFLYEYPATAARPGPAERVDHRARRARVGPGARPGPAYGPVYLFGQSLGSGAWRRRRAPIRIVAGAAGWSLVTPFDSLPNAGAAHYPFVPVHWLMIDRYNCAVANLAHFFTHPITVGVASQRARRSRAAALEPPSLRAAAEPKKMIVFKNCGHNDWPGETPDRWWDEAFDFIAPPGKLSWVARTTRCPGLCGVIPPRGSSLRICTHLLVAPVRSNDSRAPTRATSSPGQPIGAFAGCLCNRVRHAHRLQFLLRHLARGDRVTG